MNIKGPFLGLGQVKFLTLKAFKNDEIAFFFMSKALVVEIFTYLS